MIRLTIEKLDVSFESVGEVADLIDTLRSKLLGNESRPPKPVAEPKPEKPPKPVKEKTSREILDKVRERIIADPMAMNSDLAREFQISGSVVQGVRIGLRNRGEVISTESTSIPTDGVSAEPKPED